MLPAKTFIVQKSIQLQNLVILKAKNWKLNCSWTPPPPPSPLYNNLKYIFSSLSREQVKKIILTKRPLRGEGSIPHLIKINKA